MGHSESALSDLAGQLTDTIGAEHGERSLGPDRAAQPAPPDIAVDQPGTSTWRSPSCVRQLLPGVARAASRIDTALWAVVMTAYITGTSNPLDGLGQGVRCDIGISKSRVSRLCKGIDTDVAALSTRPIGHHRGRAAPAMEDDLLAYSATPLVEGLVQEADRTPQP